MSSSYRGVIITSRCCLEFQIIRCLLLFLRCYLHRCPPRFITHSVTDSLSQSLSHSSNHSLARSVTNPVTHSLDQSLTQSFTQSLTHSLTHSPTHPGNSRGSLTQQPNEFHPTSPNINSKTITPQGGGHFSAPLKQE